MRVIRVTSSNEWSSFGKSPLTLIVDRKTGKLLSRRYGSDDADSLNIPFEEDLVRVFRWTGDGPGCLTIEGGTAQEVYRLLYDIPIPKNVNFVSVSYCMCNMGYCTSIRDVVVSPPWKTYGQLLRSYAEKTVNEEGTEVHVHPDSVNFEVKNLGRTAEYKVFASCYDENPSHAVQYISDNCFYELTYSR
jgi:hypothetical protein